jgi:hypothetical protein
MTPNERRPRRNRERRNESTGQGVSPAFYRFEPDVLLVLAYLLSDKPWWPSGCDVADWLTEARTKRWDVRPRRTRAA